MLQLIRVAQAQLTGQHPVDGCWWQTVNTCTYCTGRSRPTVALPSVLDSLYCTPLYCCQPVFESHGSWLRQRYLDKRQELASAHIHTDMLTIKVTWNRSVGLPTESRTCNIILYKLNSSVSSLRVPVPNSVVRPCFHAAIQAYCRISCSQPMIDFRVSQRKERTESKTGSTRRVALSGLRKVEQEATLSLG